MPVWFTFQHFSSTHTIVLAADLMTTRLGAKKEKNKAKMQIKCATKYTHTHRSNLLHTIHTEGELSTMVVPERPLLYTTSQLNWMGIVSSTHIDAAKARPREREQVSAPGLTLTVTFFTCFMPYYQKFCVYIPFSTLLTIRHFFMKFYHRSSINYRL